MRRICHRPLLFNEAVNFYNALDEYFTTFENDDPFVFSDAGYPGGGPVPEHGTHNGPRSIDLRYKGFLGNNIQDPNAASMADYGRTSILLGKMTKYGFDQNYVGTQGDMQDFVGSVADRMLSNHNNHMHIGLSRGRFKNQYGTWPSSD